MKCKKIKDILLTEYIDGQISAGLKEQVDAHLRTCADCRLFLEQVKIKTVQPFEKAKLENPPEIVWENIKAAVQGEREREIVPAPSFAERLRSILLIPKPVFITVLVLCIAVSVFSTKYFMTQRDVNEYIEQQVSFYDSLYSSRSGNDIGIPGEEYFFNGNFYDENTV